MAGKKKIGLRERAKILEESYEAGCNITELARKHKINSRVIYGWRTKNKKIGNENGGVLSDTSTESISNNSGFVEVTVSDSAIEKEDNCNGSVSMPVLKKVLLEYENFTITVEGSQGMRVLPEIMKMMEKVA